MKDPTTPNTAKTKTRSSKASLNGESDAMGRSLELLAKVRSGVLKGNMLGLPERQSLVSLLAGDGLSGPEIAQILQVSDRTVERDRREIRERYAVPRDPRLVDQMVGRLIAEAELSMQRIRRTAREKDIDPSVKIDAEHRCFLIAVAMIDRLQKLGYLPTAATRVQADLTHSMQELPSVEDLQAQVETLQALSQSMVADSDAPPSQRMTEALRVVRSALARAEAATQIKQVANTAPLPTPHVES